MLRLVKILTGCFLLLPLFALAQTDTFVVSVFGNVDLVAPTTPTLLSAEPTTPTQINLSWSSSTDNYVVGGYIVWRDGSVIATTTQLTYTDSGLLPEVLYSYAVQAFDPFLNYSSTSNSIATTTPAVPVPPPVATTTDTSRAPEGTSVRAVADSIVIDTDITSATFNVNMSRPSSLQLRWGRTGSYELGYVVSDVFVREHHIPLTDLSPRTTYEYELTGFTPYGPGTVLQRGTFTTDGELLQFLPENVSRFSVSGVGNDVLLSWELPADQTDIAYVRVLRNHLGFPTHTQDGAVVYQGKDASVEMVDEGVLAQYSPVFYTAFVVDVHGQVSSGAIGIVFADNELVTGEGQGGAIGVAGDGSLPGATGVDIVPVATSTYSPDRMTEFTRLPQLTDITITQGTVVGDTSYTLADPALMLLTTDSFVVSVPVKLVSNNLKSIIVSVTNPTDTREQYSYLLRLNQDRSHYEATIPALYVAGQSQVTVEVYDYERYVVSSYRAPVTLVIEWPDDAYQVVLLDMFYRYIPYIAGGLLSLLLFWLFFAWRRGEDNTH